MNPSTSVLVMLAAIGAVLYLGAIDYEMLRAITFGQTTVTWDYLMPVEAFFLVPFCAVFVLIGAIDRLKALDGGEKR